MSIALSVARLVLQVFIDVHLVVTPTVAKVSYVELWRRSGADFSPISAPRLVRNGLCFYFAAGAHQLLQIKRPPTTHLIRQQQIQWPTRTTYVHADRSYEIIVRNNADFPPRTPSRLPVRLPFEMDETLWTGHKGAWKIGYRLTWNLWYSP